MTNAIQIGPLVLPLQPMLVLAAAASGLGIGKLLSKDLSMHVERTLWQSLLVGLVAARLAFVFEYASLYLASPLSIMDIRDGGWNPAVGLAATWLYPLYRSRRAPDLRRPLRWALSVGTMVFVAGSAALAFGGGTGKRMPELEFASIDGKAVRLADFAGRPTVVNLWATWCPPCVREMPMLNEAQRTNPSVNFVFINQGESAQLVATWLKGRQLGMRNVLLDPNRQASAAFEQQGYPTTLFFNAAGELVATRLGELSPATLAERLQALSH
jgi:thiol-disulfide isomerase/thioredoxin